MRDFPRLTWRCKAKALSMQLSQPIPWPDILGLTGFCYTIAREDLEVFEIVKAVGGVVTVKIHSPGQPEREMVFPDFLGMPFHSQRVPCKREWIEIFDQAEGDE